MEEQMARHKGDMGMKQIRMTLGALACALLGMGSAAASETGPLTIASQGSFFIGGQDVKSDTLSLLPAFDSAGTITVNQMYVRYQIPVAAKQAPVVFIHGCCLTGKTWETTPDGRMGWDEQFVRQGFPTYVIDQASRGRSAANPSAIVAVKGGRAQPDALPQIIGAGHEGAWAIFRFGPKYPDVFPGMQFPLEAQEEFWKQMVPDWAYGLPTPNPTVPALSKLAQKLGSAVLVSHSQSGIYPFQTAALDRAGIAGIVSIEPAACPDAKQDMAPYKGLPILVLWGDYVEKSPRWAPRLTACREFVKAANQAGGKAEMVVLNDVGFPGASHMLMQDKHSLKIGAWLADWIGKRVKKK
jgi:pimeloyl-ACP methyl ester carboxylesterase